MKIQDAKKLVQDTFNEFSGFACVLPENDLFSFAGSVKHLGWGVDELKAEFKKRYTGQEIASNSGRRLVI